MNRTSQHPAVILHMRSFGDSHANVHLLTEKTGLIAAVAYGARSGKGSLRGKVVPFAAGTVYLYYQPNRDSYKVTDFDVREYHLSIREDLTRYYAASFVSEVVWRSYAGGHGDTGEAYRLVLDTFRLLQQSSALDGRTATEQPAEYGRFREEKYTPTIRTLGEFMWRYLDVLGLQPAPENVQEERLRAQYGSHYGGGPYGSHYGGGHHQTPQTASSSLSASVTGHLRGSHGVTMADAVRTFLPPPETEALFDTMLVLISDALHGEIKSLELLVRHVK